jgi:hypothetical protein
MVESCHHTLFYIAQQCLRSNSLQEALTNANTNVEWPMNLRWIVGSCVEHRARVDPVKMWDAFKRHLTPEIKSTITGSSIHRPRCHIWGGWPHNCRCYMLWWTNRSKTPKQLCSEFLLTDEHAMTQLEESRYRVGYLFQWITTAWRRFHQKWLWRV